jgi:hypothetical protein
MVGLKVNERLAKLTEQCYEYNETMQGTWFNKTKFAELIVKECAEMGDNFDGQPTGNAVRKYLTAGDAIREYFGVE